MANLYNKAGLINIPVGYSDGFLYNIKPTDNTLGFKFDRASAATRVNKEGLIENAQANVPRIDYTDSLTSPSFLLEPQSTNLVTFSEDFSQSVWNTWQSTKTEINNINPTGLSGYYQISHTGSSTNNPNTRLTNVSLNGAYTLSVFVKTNQSRYISLTIDDYNGDRAKVYFDTINKTFTTVSNVGSPITNTSYNEFLNDWVRISLSVNLSNAVYNEVGFGSYNPSGSFTSASGEVISIWGAQLEQKSYPTSYIPTAGSTATRAQETCSGAGNASTFNDSEGVLYAEISGFKGSAINRYISISDGTNQNSVSIALGGNNFLYVTVISNNATQYSRFYALSNGFIAENNNKIALHYKQNDIFAYLNGNKILAETTGNSPIGLNTLNFDRGNGFDDFYGKVKSVIAFKEALNDYELAELTSLVELNPFTFTVKTDNSGTSNTDQFTLPLTDNGAVDIVVDWGDGTIDTITAFDQPEKTHTYPSAGTYEIKIIGTLQGFIFSNTGDKSKMLDIKKWGIFDVNFTRTFKGCNNLTQSATDTPIISATNFGETFQICSVFNGDISFWDVSGTTGFANFFNRAKLFNRDISSWDMSSATNLTAMFKDAETFNKDISSWDVSNVNNFKEMFRETNDFNQPIGSWTIKNVVNQNINMQRMFRQAKSFDQSLANWNMEQVNNLQEFLLDAGLSTANYNATLIGWAAQTVQSGLTCDFGNSQYTAGGAAEAARNKLINTYGWTITDGGAA